MLVNVCPLREGRVGRELAPLTGAATIEAQWYARRMVRKRNIRTSSIAVASPPKAGIAFATPNDGLAKTRSAGARGPDRPVCRQTAHGEPVPLRAFRSYR